MIAKQGRMTKDLSGKGFEIGGVLTTETLLGINPTSIKKK